MKQRLVNKHIIRAISLGLTAVMASTPITALAEEVIADPIVPQPLPELETDLLKNKEAEDAIEAAQETVDEGDVVKLDQPVELPGSGKEAEVVPNAQDAAGASELENVQTKVNGVQIEYKDVKDDLANAGNDLRSAESDLIQMDIAEGKAKADVETGTSFMNQSNAISNSVTVDHTAAENAATNSQQAVEKAQVAESSSEIKEALEVADDAVKTTKAAQEEAQKKYDASEAELTKAHDKLVEAEKNLEAARASLTASRSDVDKALKELEEAKKEAELLQEQVNKDAQVLKESQAAQLKAAYDKMKATAANEQFKLYDGGAVAGDGKEDEYSKEFGREKASSQYWADSLEYFKLYMDYAYRDDSVAETKWIEQGEHFAKNNVYEITYNDGSKRYFNYHLEDETGEISIYEKTEGTEEYVETTFEEGTKLVQGDEVSSKTYYENPTIEDGKVDVATETIEYVVEKERITEMGPFKNLDEFKAMLNSVQDGQVYEIEMESSTGNSKQIYTFSYGQSVEMAIKDMFGLSQYTSADGEALKFDGQYLGRVYLKEESYKELGIKETVTANVVIKESVIERLLYNQHGDSPSNSLYAKSFMIVEDAKALGGTARDIEIVDVNERKYTFSYTLELEDGTTKLVKGIVTDGYSGSVNSVSSIRNDIINEAKDLGKTVDEDSIKIVFGTDGSHTYTYDLVSTEKKVLKETIYSASYENYKKEVNVTKERSFWQERKNSEKDDAVRSAIAQVQEKLNALSNQQDAAAKAYAAVEQAEIDAEKAKAKLDQLNVDDAGYKKAWVDYDQAKNNLAKANEQLENIKQKVTKTQDDYDKIAGMLKDKMAEDSKGEDKGTELEPEVTLEPTPGAGTPQGTPEVTPEPTPEAGTPQGTPEVTPAPTQPSETPDAAPAPTQPAGAPQVVEDAEPVLVAAADEEVPLAGDLQDMIGDQEVEEEDTNALVELEEEAVPLASTELPKEGMSWWWLLIVALMGATGYKMYEKHQEKKELKEKE